MSILIAPLPVQSFRDNNGNPLAGGQLYTYQAGTSTLQTTYTDATGTTPNTNPIILNSRGEANIWLTSGQSYKLVLQDSYGVLIWSVDQMTSGAAASGANSDITSLLGLTTPLSISQGGTGAIAFDAARYALSASSSGFRNVIINGDHAIDPNGAAAVTVIAGAALVPATEMFYMACTGANVTYQQVTGADGRKRSRFTGAAGNTGIIFGTRIEAKNSMELAGAVATLSEKISSSSLTSIPWAAYYANTADTFGTLASPTRTAIASGSITISATETVFSNQISMPSGATTGIEIVFTPGALLASQTLTFGDNQLEPGAIGTSAITFEKVEISQQLARTQRYFEIGAGSISGYNAVVAANDYRVPINFKATKRVVPVVLYTVSTSTQVSAYSTISPSVNGCVWFCTTSANTVAFFFEGNWSANARLF